MSILSLYFLAFLLLASVLFYLVPNKVKPLVILAANVCFYLQFGIKSAVFLLFSIVTVYAGALLVEKIKKLSL